MISSYVKDILLLPLFKLLELFFRLLFSFFIDGEHGKVFFYLDPSNTSFQFFSFIDLHLPITTGYQVPLQYSGKVVVHTGWTHTSSYNSSSSTVQFRTQYSYIKFYTQSSIHNSSVWSIFTTICCPLTVGDISYQSTQFFRATRQQSVTYIYLRLFTTIQHQKGA